MGSRLGDVKGFRGKRDVNSIILVNKVMNNNYVI